MNEIIFDNHIKVEVTQEPASPSVGDAVRFIAAPKLIFPDSNKLAEDSYSFDYTWVVSNDGGQTYTKTGENANILIVPSITPLFVNQIYKVKVAIRDLEDSILTENGYFLTTQIGEILIGNNLSSGLSIQSQEATNDASSSSDLVPKTNITTETSLNFLNLEDVLKQSEVFDTTINENVKAEILSGQAPSINLDAIKSISSPNPETVSIVDTSSIIEVPLEQQSIQLFSNCARKIQRSTSIGNATISWSECKEMPGTWGNNWCNGQGVYLSQGACEGDVGSGCGDSSSRPASKILADMVIPNFWNSSTGETFCCSGGFQLECAGGKKNLCTPDNICNGQSLTVQTPAEAEAGPITNSAGGASDVCPCSGRRDEKIQITVTTWTTPQNGLLTVGLVAAGIFVLVSATVTGGAGVPILGPVILEYVSAPLIGKVLIAWGAGIGVWSGSTGTFKFVDPGTSQEIEGYKCFDRYYNHLWKCSTSDLRKQTPGATSNVLNSGATETSPVAPSPNSTATPEYSCTNGGSIQIELKDASTCTYQVTGNGFRGKTHDCTLNDIGFASFPPSVPQSLNFSFPPQDPAENLKDFAEIDNGGPIGCVRAKGTCQSKCSGEQCCPIKYGWEVKSQNGNFSCDEDINYPVNGFLGTSLNNNETFSISACRPDSDNEYSIVEVQINKRKYQEGDYTSAGDAEAEAMRMIGDNYGLIFRWQITKCSKQEAEANGVYNEQIITYPLYNDILETTTDIELGTLITSYKKEFVGYTTVGSDRCNLCDPWYKISSRYVMQYPCNDANENLCGVPHPGDCNKPNSDKTTPIKIRKIKEIKRYDARELARMKADPTNYFDSLDGALARARNEASEPRMICPDV